MSLFLLLKKALYFCPIVLAVSFFFVRDDKEKWLTRGNLIIFFWNFRFWRMVMWAISFDFYCNCSTVRQLILPLIQFLFFFFLNVIIMHTYFFVVVVVSFQVLSKRRYCTFSGVFRPDARNKIAQDWRQIGE